MSCRCARSISISCSAADGCSISVPLVCEMVIATGSFNLQHGCYHIFTINCILACRAQLQGVINLHLCHLDAVAGALACHLHTENRVGMSCRCARGVGTGRSAADGCSISVPLVSEVIITTGSFNLQHGCYHIFTINCILACRAQLQGVINLHLCHLDAVAGALACHLHTEYRIGVSCRCARGVGVGRSAADGCAVSVPLISEMVITTGSFNLQHGCNHIFTINRILACQIHTLGLINLDVSHLDAIISATVIHLHRIIIITSHIGQRDITIAGCAANSRTILIPLVGCRIRGTFGHTHRQGISCAVQTVVRIDTIIGQRKRLKDANVGHMHRIVIATIVHLHRIIETSRYSGERSITVGSGTADGHTILVPLISSGISEACCHTHGELFGSSIQTVVRIRIDIGYNKRRINQYLHRIRLVVCVTAVDTASGHHISKVACRGRNTLDSVLAIAMAGQCQTIQRKIW